jgi:hypothetical protein
MTAGDGPVEVLVPSALVDFSAIWVAVEEAVMGVSPSRMKKAAFGGGLDNYY